MPVFFSEDFLLYNYDCSQKASVNSDLKTPSPLCHSCSMKVTAVSWVMGEVRLHLKSAKRRSCQLKAGAPLVWPGGVSCFLRNLHSINYRIDLFRDGNLARVYI